MPDSLKKLVLGVLRVYSDINLIILCAEGRHWGSIQ